MNNVAGKRNGVRATRSKGREANIQQAQTGLRT